MLAAISLTLAFAVAEGEARTHATGHLVLGFLSIALFVSVGLLWTPPEGSRASLVRAGILVITAMGAFGQVLESIGASGYDRFNAGHEIEFLTGIHNAVGILGPVALMAIPIGLVALRCWRSRASSGAARRPAPASASAGTRGRPTMSPGRATGP